jgi:hypothetical protein
MKNSTLHIYSKILTPKEQEEFGQYLTAMGKTNLALLKFWQIISENTEGPDGHYFEKEQLFHLIFDNKKSYNDLTMRRLMSNLTNHIRHFLSYKAFKNSPLEEIYLFKALQNKGVDKLLEKEITDFSLDFDKENQKDSAYYFNAFLMQKEASILRGRFNRTGDMKLQEMSDAITGFYVSEVLKQACQMLSHQNLTQQNYNQPFLEPILEKINKGDLSVSPSIKAYFHAYQFLLDESQVIHFQYLKNIIKEYWTQFSLSDLKELYVLAINFCIKKQNKNEDIFVHEALDLYKSGLETSALLENDKISPFTYINVFRLAMKIEDTVWARQFLDDYKPKLPTSERENYFKYNLARWYFVQNDKNAAMKLLQEVNLKEVLYNLDARQMLLRIYFESKEFLALDSLLESFKTYLMRQKNVGYHSQSYLNLIKFTKKILKLDNKDKGQIEQLKQQIEATDLVTEKAWLLLQLTIWK